MNYDQAVVDFLVQPENLSVVLEIARRADSVKNHLQLQFWQLYREEMQRRLQAAGAAGRWEVLLPTPQRLLGDWANCRISYRLTSKQVLHLDLALESGQRQSNCLIYYGLRWSREVREPVETPALAHLLRVVDGGRDTGIPSPPWWILYFKLDQRIREDDFLLRLAAEPTQVATTVSDSIWTYFEQLREPLEAANESLVAFKA